MKRSLLVLLVGLTLASCSFKPDGTCGTAADCNPGQACTSGICVGCQVDADCQPWQACDGQRRCVTAAGRCASDQGCEAWQACDATHACALRPGACDAGGGCQAWQSCTVHACTLPAGRCDGVADCGAAQICTADHRCVSGCPTGNECQAWEACSAEQQCVLQPGRCLATIDCSAWQTCDVPSHTCALTPGKCDAGVGCRAWETCDVHDCTLQANRCNVAGDCAAWQTCDATNTCALAAGKCDAGVGCRAWETCDVHDCTLQANRCNVAGDCAAWQTCDATNTCALAPGRCDAGVGCQAWESCGATSHTCAPLPGRCTVAADCPGWQTCAAGNVCADVTIDAAGAYYFGSLSSHGFGLNGLASPYAPTSPFISLPDLTDRIVIHPDGGIVYMTSRCPDTAQRCIRRAASDQLTWDGYWWDPPLAPLDNDAVLLQRPNIWAFRLQEGTGQILYGEPGPIDGMYHWYDQSGTERATHGEVLAWNSAGSLLFRRDDSIRQPDGKRMPLQVISPEGVAVDVPGIVTDGVNLCAARARGAGFWLYRGNSNFGAEALERWSIAADGTAVKDGDYANPGFIPYVDYKTVIDAAGDLWAMRFNDVYRTRLLPEAAVLVLPEGVPAGYNDAQVNPFRPYLDTFFGQLATGP